MNKEILKQMINCAKREVKQRKFVYPKLVSRGKMTQEKADYEIKTMKLIQLSLQKIYDGKVDKTIQTTLFNQDNFKKKMTVYDYETNINNR